MILDHFMFNDSNNEIWNELKSCFGEVIPDFHIKSKEYENTGEDEYAYDLSALPSPVSSPTHPHHFSPPPPHSLSPHPFLPPQICF